jgi:hypothetical protein
VIRQLIKLEAFLGEYFINTTDIDVKFLFRVALAVFWLGATIILLYENFKNGVPPDPDWYAPLKETIGVTW